MKEKIFERISDIRNVLSEKFLFNELLKNSIVFNQCYASMDLLEDTEYAINYYKYSDFSNKALGEKYILLYGLFESFYIQYDAVKKITNSIIHLLNNANLISENDFINEFAILNKIKEYCNDIAGHPAYRDKDKYSVYLSQFTISKNIVEYIQSNTLGVKKIDIIEGIEMQEQSILEILNKILEKLKIKQEEHYTKYKNEKLYELFHNKYMYPREKVHRSDMLDLSLSILKKLSNDIKEKLNERYVNYEDLEFDYLIHDIDGIIVFLESKIEDIDAAYRDFIEKNLIENMVNKFDEVMEILREIDKEYERYFNPPKQSEDLLRDININIIRGEDAK